MDLSKKIQSFDERRDIVVGGTAEETLNFCLEHFIAAANQAIEEHGFFTVALSGGSTPNGIFKRLALPENLQRINWKKVYVFWSDERAVPPENPESNFGTAMEAGIKNLGIPAGNIHRMIAEQDIESNALAYEKLILEKVSGAKFDLIMLGMGDDGHTASLFPHTRGLHSQDQLVVANYIDTKRIWRMTFTYKLINQAKQVVIYVIGRNKSGTLKNVLKGPFTPDELPSQKIGTPDRHALWIVDAAAAYELSAE
jgi:6-phosphogluconolactonase